MLQDTTIAFFPSPNRYQYASFLILYNNPSKDSCHSTPHHSQPCSSSSKHSCASSTGLACLSIKYNWNNSFLGVKKQKRCHSPTVQAEDRLPNGLLCFKARHHHLHFIVKEAKSNTGSHRRVNNSHSMKTGTKRNPTILGEEDKMAGQCEQDLKR